MRRRFLPMALVGVMATAACTGGGGSRPTGEGASHPAGGASSEADGPRAVASPWKPGMAQYGVNIYWEDSRSDSDEVVRAKADRILDYVVGLNANSVTFSFPVYTTGIHANTVRAGAKTPSPARVRIAIEEATKRALRSGIRPILNEAALIAEDPIAWRGTIAPSSRAAWFTNYESLLMPYAVVGAAGAKTFVVGTEFNSLEEDPRWASLVKKLKTKFSGEIAYSANFDNFQQGDVGVPADVVGVDAYIKLGKLPDNASASRIAAGWNKWLEKNHPDGPPILQEVGIAAQSGAYLQPGNWGDGKKPMNLIVQQHWYEGVCQALHDGHASGVYWWKIDFDADPATAKPTSKDRMTFIGRPAEATVRTCFSKPA